VTPEKPEEAEVDAAPGDATNLRVAVCAVAVLAALSAALGIGVRATFGAHVAVDEVQYLLSALSLAEDGNLDISDELAEQRWRAFADEEPPVQTQVLAGGRQVSPHDPLLSALLALPMGWGGWVAAKAVLALFAGVLAGLTVWVAVRRCAVPLRLATAGVGLASASAPLAVYGQQVYPELPAALAVLLGVAALTGPLRPSALAIVAATVTLAPWLSVKYAPVVAVLAVLAAVRWWRAGHRRAVAWFGAALVAMGLVYLGVHQLVWGGWTAYASGDHFVDTGELSVVGTGPDYLGRSVRLVGLLVDRDFGLAAWQPGWLLLLPALGALAVRPPRWSAALAVPFSLGVLVATYVALTMHGFWWPGRQLVVVLPLALLLILGYLSARGTAVRVVAFGLGLVGVANYGALLVDGYQADITWVSQFATVAAAPYRLYRDLLPDYRADFWPLHLGWMGLVVVLVVLGWHSVAAGRVGAAP